ncbi:MAG: hypothetical protein ACRCU5_05410 [Rhizobiaceae bacterium]
MGRWFTKKISVGWIVLLWLVSAIYETFIKPIIALNIETWATNQKLQDEILDGGQQIVPFLIEIWKPIDAIMGYLASPWFFGFAVGAILFGFWDPVSVLLSKANDRRLPHPSLKPTNGLHPAVISFKRDEYGQMNRIENYGVARFLIYPNGDRILIALFFERLTGTQQIEVTNLAGEELYAKQVSADNRLLVLEFSKRPALEGVRISCYELGSTRRLTRLENVKPLLPSNTATEKQP